MARAAREEKLQAAYRQVLTAATLILHSLDAARVTAEVRSGVQDQISILMRQRKPLDLFGMAKRLRRVVEPLYSALAGGTPETSRPSNTVVNRATDVVEVLTEQSH